MSTMNPVYSQALGMSISERKELAMLLLESLPEGDQEFALDPDYEAELMRRLDESDRGQARMLTLGEVMARLRGETPAPNP